MTGGIPGFAYFQYTSNGNGLVSMAGSQPGGTTVPSGKIWVVHSIGIVNLNTVATEIRIVQRAAGGTVDIRRSQYEPCEPTYGYVWANGPLVMVAADYLKLDISNGAAATLALDVGVDYFEYTL